VIDRIVLIKLKDEYATNAGREEVRQRTLTDLNGLPQIRGLKVGLPADPSSLESWDISILLQFESMDEVQAYLPHPDHRRYVDEFLRPRMDCIKAWNFQS
jgi:hypothetical protein